MFSRDISPVFLALPVIAMAGSAVSFAVTRPGPGDTPSAAVAGIAADGSGQRGDDGIPYSPDTDLIR